MTYQNRLALDLVLAERGGVCSMFGQDCCVFIPNNTAPDGSISRALTGLKDTDFLCTSLTDCSSDHVNLMQLLYPMHQAPLSKVYYHGH